MSHRFLEVGEKKSAKRALRNAIWNKMLDLKIALPPMPIHGRIPNFLGAREAASKLFSEPEWRKASVVKVNPDSPQRWVRLRALEEGKTLLMPTPRIREGFVVLEPRFIPAHLYERASTIKGAFELGRVLRRVDELSRAVPSVDLIVEGSVVVNTYGERLGKGEGYGELEYAILLELGIIDPDVPIATTVHDVQVIDSRIPQEVYDVPIDLICTPTRVIRVRERGPRPPGVLWELLDEEKLESIPILRELKSRRAVS
ncbi:MAG: 5-formyltetrahydrofolate cyclo-ligase [Acidilobaceae archaeon]